MNILTHIIIFIIGSFFGGFVIWLYAKDRIWDEVYKAYYSEEKYQLVCVAYREAINKSARFKNL